MVADLRLSAGAVQWVVDAYSLVFAGLLLTAGALSDRFGRKRGLLLGLALFGGASAAAAFAGSAAALITCRGLMGVGGAFLMPGTLSILVHVFDDEERPRAIGVWGGVSALGVAAGPVLGGLLVDHFRWASVFLINVPVVVVALVAAAVLVPESHSPRARRADLVGAVLATVGVTAAVWAVIDAPEHGWRSTSTVGGLLVAASTLTAFLAWERHTPIPMLDLALLRNRRFAGASAVGVLLLFALAGTTFLLTQYLQLVLGFSPLTAGLGTLPVALAIAVTAPQAPQLARAVGDGTAIAAGLLLLAAGLVVLAALASQDAYWPVLCGGVLIGAGLGILGTLAASVYRDRLPADAPGPVRSSLAGALAGGDEVMAASARAAFDAALSHALLTGAVTVAVGALVGWRMLAPGPSRSDVSSRSAVLQ
jgi:EmrB/QacA subfamily drug resistance transporter